MNKFLLLALSVFALGLAVPAMATEEMVETEAEQVVEVCLDEQGVEMECPVVEETDVEGDAAVEVEAEVDAEAATY